MRPSPIPHHNLLEIPKVGPVLDVRLERPVDNDSHIARGAAVRRREPRLVARREAHLDRRVRREPLRLDREQELSKHFLSPVRLHGPLGDVLVEEAVESEHLVRRARAYYFFC